MTRISVESVITFVFILYILMIVVGWKVAFASEDYLDGKPVRIIVYCDHDQMICEQINKDWDRRYVDNVYEVYVDPSTIDSGDHSIIKSEELGEIE